MAAPSAGAVILVRFPFTDLSAAKLRPAIVLADAGMGDWILCQITSNSYRDPRAIEINSGDFARGSLDRQSYARPGKLFTANHRLVTAEVGALTSNAFDRVIAAIVKLLRP